MRSPRSQPDNQSAIFREMSNPAQPCECGRGRLIQTASLKTLCDRQTKPDFWTVFACAKENKNMLWTIFVILGILWLLGFSLHIGGSLIHLLLVVAVVVLV